MITKEKLLKHIESFPSEMSYDDVIEKIRFIQILEERIEKSNNESNLLSEEEVDKEVESWFK